MNTSTGSNPGEIEKQVYLSGIELKLAEKRAALKFIKRRVKRSVESHRIGVSQQLKNASLHADSSLASLRAQLELLEKADGESWRAKRFEVEVAWEDLSQAISKFVARFP